MKTFRVVFFTIMFGALIIFPAFAREVSVRFFSKYEIKDAVITAETGHNESCRLTLNNNIIEADYGGYGKEKGKAINLFNGAYGKYTVETAGQKRGVPGSIKAMILKNENGIVLVSTMDIEDYVPCVLSAEEDDNLYTPELAKAHAIVIRTFATLNNKRHEFYDFCDLTHCEEFKGIPMDEKKWYRPVKETKGMILAGDCAKDSAYFSACCGGITENAGEFATGKAGKCGKSIPDVLNGKVLCKNHRYFRWVKTVNHTDIEAALSVFVHETNLEVISLTITARTQSGRAKQMKFSYKTAVGEKSVVVDANRYFSVFGKKAGWALIPSKLFEVEKQGGVFVFTGKGHGHGVGLCLQGAHELAVMGKNFKEILDFYFSGLGLTKI